MKKWIIGVPVIIGMLVGTLTVMYLESTKDAEPAVVAPSPTTPVAGGGPAPAAPSPDLEAAEKQKQALELELAKARRELTGLRMHAASKTATPAATNAAPEPPESFMASLASMMDSPDMQEVMQVQARMALEQTHGESVRGV